MFGIVDSDAHACFSTSHPSQRLPSQMIYNMNYNIMNIYIQNIYKMYVCVIVYEHTYVIKY